MQFCKVVLVKKSLQNRFISKDKQKKDAEASFRCF